MLSTKHYRKSHNIPLSLTAGIPLEGMGRNFVAVLLCCVGFAVSLIASSATLAFFLLSRQEAGVMMEVLYEGTSLAIFPKHDLPHSFKKFSHGL